MINTKRIYIMKYIISYLKKYMYILGLLCFLLIFIKGYCIKRVVGEVVKPLLTTVSLYTGLKNVLGRNPFNDEREWNWISDYRNYLFEVVYLDKNLTEW